MSREREAYMPADLRKRVLECATRDVVLVGGQALAFWMDTYDIQTPGMLPAISRDVDFFTRDAANSGPLVRFARAIHGRAEVEDPRTLTALIGSAIAPAEEDRVYNVDLLHAVVGLERDHVEANAVEVAVPGGSATIRVMHPLDVLQSRNANLHKLPEKQDEIGQLQFRLAIEVARKFLEAQMDELGAAKGVAGKNQERQVFDLIGLISDYSTEDAAKKNADRYGIFLADAIPAWRIASSTFWEKQWPFLRQRMSAEYASQCEEQARRG